MSPHGARYRWYALGVTTYTQASAAAVTATIGPIAPLLQADFGISRAEVGLFQGAIYFSATFASLAGGRLADRAGERIVLILSGVIAGVASLAIARVGTFPMLLALALLVGLGFGIQHPAGSAAVMRWFPPHRRGSAMGIRQTGVPLGGVLAAAVWPIATGLWGWRSAYLLSALMMLLGAALIIFTYVDPRRETGPGAERPRAMRDLMGDRKLMRIAVIYNAQVMAQYAVTVYLVLFLHEALGMPLVLAASLLAVVNLAAIAGRIGWGVASDALFGGARQPVLVIVIALTLASVLLAAALPRGTPVALIVVLAVMLGVTAYSWTGIYTALTVETAGRASAATAVAWVHVLGGLGSFGGAPLFGWVVDATGSYRVAWLVVAAVVLTGLVAALRVRETRPL